MSTRISALQEGKPDAEISPWKLGGLTVGQLGKRLWIGLNDDDIFGRAAQLAYSFFFSIFPLLLFLTSVVGVIARNNPSLRAGLVNALTSSMPGTASGLIQQVVHQTTTGTGAGKLSFGIVLALISASSGMSAIMDTLNAAYNVKEGRSFVRYRSLALGLTIAIGILIVAAAIVILYGNSIVDLVANSIGLGSLAAMAWKILQWPIAICFLVLSYALMYYYGPDVEQPKWHWITPGSVAGVFLSLVVSFAFRIYIHYFNSYNQTYGSLGAVMILLLWFYVMGLAILTGGEVNAEIENAAAKRGAPVKEKGQKTPKTPKESAA